MEHIQFSFVIDKEVAREIEEKNKEEWLKNKKGRKEGLRKSVTDIIVNNKKEEGEIINKIKRYIKNYQEQNYTFRGGKGRVVKIINKINLRPKIEKLRGCLLLENINLSISHVAGIYFYALLDETKFFSGKVKEYLKNLEEEKETMKSDDEIKRCFKNLKKEKKPNNEEKNENEITVEIKRNSINFTIKGRSIEIKENEEEFEVYLKK